MMVGAIQVAILLAATSGFVSAISVMFTCSTLLREFRSFSTQVRELEKTIICLQTRERELAALIPDSSTLHFGES